LLRGWDEQRSFFSTASNQKDETKVKNGYNDQLIKKQCILPLDNRKSGILPKITEKVLYMSNIRRFLRYNITIPIYIKEENLSKSLVNKSREDLIGPQEMLDLETIDADIKNILRAKVEPDSELDLIVHFLGIKINLVGFLLDLLVGEENPALQEDFKFRIREYKKQKIVNSLSGTKVGILVDGLEDRIKEHVFELLETVSNSIEGSFFLYPRKPQPLFKADNYVKNLAELAEKEVTIAVLFELLIKKLNIWENIYTRLKEKHKEISDHTNWGEYDINLSAGGLSLLSDRCFPQFTMVNVLMKLGNNILVNRAKVLSSKADEEKCRIALEFDFLSVEKARIISEYLQKQELIDTMENVELNFTA